MNITQARNEADTVANVQFDSSVYNRFKLHAERDQPIKYFDRMAPEKKGLFRILGACNGLPNEITFYLKRV